MERLGPGQSLPRERLRERERGPLKSEKPPAGMTQASAEIRGEREEDSESSTPAGVVARG
jgi:hypothetical protein